MKKDQDLYPDADFLRDYDLWHRHVSDPFSPWHNQGQVAALHLLSLQYQKQPDAFRYRKNRFECILGSVYSKMPQLVQDRVALSDSGDGAQMPEHLFLAVLAWYRTVSDQEIRKMPDPDWPWVLDEYDRLDAKFPN